MLLKLGLPFAAGLATGAIALIALVAGYAVREPISGEPIDFAKARLATKLNKGTPRFVPLRPPSVPPGPSQSKSAGSVQHLDGSNRAQVQPVLAN